VATVKETARFYGVSERTIQRWAHERKLTAHKERKHGPWVIAEGKHFGGTYSAHRVGGAAEVKQKREAPKLVPVRQISRPKLVGTEKQIAYAEKIRAAYIRVQEYDSHRDKRILTEAKTDLAHQSSIWWIEYRKQYIFFDSDYRRLKKDYG